MTDPTPTRYSPAKIEPKWQKIWDEQKLFAAPAAAPEKRCYILDMFPYPSGAGLHVGHPEGYTATDIVARKRRAEGYAVLHPMGWDAFGLPAENYAIKTGTPPAESTAANIVTFKRQIQSLGFSYDWTREIATCDPEYYRWTQWWFLFLFKQGLAYQADAAVNWCDDCKTVLANEQVVDGACERCKNPVVQKKMRQWFLKITDFVEDKVGADGRVTSGLLSGLAKIDWPESTKVNQENWIGRSTGLVFRAPVKDLDLEIETYSAHFEACYADTFVVIAPDHPLLPKLVAGLPEEKVVLAFAQSIVDERATTREEREPTGIFTGRYIVDPLGNGDLPIWVASFALANYGTGIVKCSAHDERDFAFAKKYGIPLKTVLLPNDPAEAERVRNLEYCYFDMKNGQLTEPAELAGAITNATREAVANHCEARGFAKRATKYRLRDWLVSRQRYWGAPIPIIHCQACGAVPVPESELPVRLPTDVDFRPTGESPLALSPTFHDVKCPKCSAPARRESDTMDTFVCSSWYFFAFAAAEALKKGENPMLAPSAWLPVDLYVGGAEHTVLHLLYSRFFAKVAHAAGLTDCDEPFAKLRHQGMILGEDNQKMSKSRGNVVNPDAVVAEHGADTLRIYEMFMGPFEGSCPWNTAGVAGVRRFLDKVWRLFTTKNLEGKPADGCPLSATPEFRRQLHTTIKKVSEDIENFSFNTAVSQLMIFVNFCGEQATLPLPGMRKFLQLLAPFAPHLAEELWQQTGGTESIQRAAWPVWKAEYLVADTLTLAVQVNGKLRAAVEVPASASREEQLAAAKRSEKVQKWLTDELKKEVVVPGKLVNFVVA